MAGDKLQRTSDGVLWDTELWRSDGTAIGTYRVKDINPGVGGSDLGFGFATPEIATGVVMVNAGSTLYFRANDGVHGMELWRSDGTAVGTVIVKDINPGIGDSCPAQLTAVGNDVYFIASDGVRGFELWRSNGTEAGTVMLGDIAQGEDWVVDDSLRLINGRLYFNAKSSEYGKEVWTYSPPPSVRTGPVARITQTGAVVNGFVNPNGIATTVRIEYGTSTSYGKNVSVTLAPSNGSVQQSVNASLSGLTPGTTYHCRIVATNGTNSVEGESVSFTTLAAPPKLPRATTGLATGLIATSATLAGSVNPMNGLTTVFIDYGLTQAYGTTVTLPSTLNGGSAQNVATTITGLQIGKVYQFRVRAVNRAGTGLGANRTFTAK
jgi:ELWxxDGT repeat protein